MVDVSNVLSGILRFRVTKSNNLWNVVQVEKSYPVLEYQDQSRIRSKNGSLF